MYYENENENLESNTTRNSTLSTGAKPKVPNTSQSKFRALVAKFESSQIINGSSNFGSGNAGVGEATFEHGAKKEVRNRRHEIKPEPEIEQQPTNVNQAETGPKEPKRLTKESASTSRKSVLVTKSFFSGGRIHLKVEEGDILTVINTNNRKMWWLEDAEGRQGFVPANVLEELDNFGAAGETVFAENLFVKPKEKTERALDKYNLKTKRLDFGKYRHEIGSESESESDKACRFSDFEGVSEEEYSEDESDGLVECGVCGGEFEEAIGATFGCRHLFCRECMSRHVKSRIEDHQLRDFKCPETDCDRTADQATVEMFLDYDDLVKLEDLQLRDAAGDIPEVYYCPLAECGKLVQIFDDSFATCPCGYIFCTNCNQSYHGGLECGLSDQERRLQLLEFLQDQREASEGERWRLQKERERVERLKAAERARRQREEAAAEALIRQECKRCPGCSAEIFKIDGCNHMHCIKCCTHFCWLCRSILSESDIYEHFGSDCVLFEVPPED